MSQIPHTSPFDGIRHEDEDGSEELAQIYSDRHRQMPSYGVIRSTPKDMPLTHIIWWDKK